MTQSKPLVNIILVTYNAEKYLIRCLQSVLEQTYDNFEVLIIDNGSTDNTLSIIREKFPQLKIVEQSENYGFSKSYNKGIAWTKGEFIMCLNQDLVLNKDYLEKVINAMQEDSKIAAVTGTLMQWDFANDKFTTTIDTCGLTVLKNHRVIDRYQGREISDFELQSKHIFGVSAAAAVYRRQALQSVSVPINKQYREYFDESFFAYKEDVDLAFRLQLNNWSAYHLAEAKAFHDRTTKQQPGSGTKDTFIAHRKKNKLINYLSYRNHLLMLVKNEFIKNIFLYSYYIIPFEIAKLLYNLIFNRKIDKKQWPSFIKILPMALKKRRYIFKNIVKISANELKKWYA